MEQYISKDFADGPSVDAALKKALNSAPGGFGLGVSGTPISDPDNATSNGWYQWSTGTENTPFNYGVLLTLARSGSSITQIAFENNANESIVTRTKISANWADSWRYLNPPLLLGVEYRTVERYLGKPVYQKLINFGALPSNSEKRVEHGIENFKLCASVQGTLGGYNLVGFGTPDMHVTGIYADGVSVRITTDGDFSSYASLNTYVLIKYTKSTD